MFQRENYMNADNGVQQSIQIVQDKRVKSNVIRQLKVIRVNGFHID